MEAFIARNLTAGKILIKGPNSYTPPIELKYGESYLFKSPQEYQTYKKQVDVMVGAKFLEVSTVSGKASFNRELEKRIEEPKYYEDDSETYFEKNREVITVREVQTATVNIDEVKVKAKALRKEYKNADGDRKVKIKEELEELKKQLGE